VLLVFTKQGIQSIILVFYDGSLTCNHLLQVVYSGYFYGQNSFEGCGSSLSSNLALHHWENEHDHRQQQKAVASPSCSQVEPKQFSLNLATQLAGNVF